MLLPLIDHKAVLPYIEELKGRDLILGSLNARCVRPGEGEQMLPSDVPLVMHRYGRDAPIMMNTVWTLSDLTPPTAARG